MRIMAHVAMVMNLDKCIGCHTCSVTCKQTWTNRDGVEYAWFNNVETKPGLGYPRAYEDQERWRGGWQLRGGKLQLRSGGRIARLAQIFANPRLPGLEDYYEPASYDFDTLVHAPAQDQVPVARPISALTGKPMAITSGPNWDDNLAGSQELAAADPNLAAMREEVKLSFEQTFMFHLPRICEHCLNPACSAACPSGAIYKREQDGIVHVDQNKCRGWRMCVTACPYKKIYLNHVTGKAEKCHFCFPRIEAGQPTVCSETCVGRLRYLGLVLYDADKVAAAATVEDPAELLEAQREVFCDPFDPAVIEAARAAGIAEDWIAAAQASPIWALAMKHRVALPLHPEYRTLPMVWYIPPLSPVLQAASALGGDDTQADDVFHAITELRIPMEYLAQLFTAGDVDEIAGVLMKLAAMRQHMRSRSLDGAVDEELLARVGASAEELESLYRLLAIAKMQDRYVVPPAHAERAVELSSWASGCSLDAPGGAGMSDAGGGVRHPGGTPAGKRPVPVTLGRWSR